MNDLDFDRLQTLDQTVGDLWRDYRRDHYDTSLDDFRASVLDDPAVLRDRMERTVEPTDLDEFRHWMVRNDAHIVARYADEEHLTACLDSGELPTALDFEGLATETVTRALETYLDRHPDALNAVLDAVDPPTPATELGR